MLAHAMSKLHFPYDPLTITCLAYAALPAKSQHCKPNKLHIMRLFAQGRGLFGSAKLYQLGK